MHPQAVPEALYSSSSSNDGDDEFNRKIEEDGDALHHPRKAFSLAAVKGACFCAPSFNRLSLFGDRYHGDDLQRASASLTQADELIFQVLLLSTLLET